MDVIEFAASRAGRLADADKEIAPLVAKALDGFGGHGWSEDLIEAASVLWLEIFEKEAPKAYTGVGLLEFQELLRESLGKTAAPSTPPTESEISRVTKWLGTITVNDATFHGNRARGGRKMTWVCRSDDSVREMHREVDGQTRSVTGTFSVGGQKLRYPGEPVGPPEVWINCRCLLAGGKVKAAVTASAATKTPPVPIEDEDNVDSMPEGDDTDTPDVPADDLVDAPVVTPWHGVLAPENVASGDGRIFALNALTWRDLPLPLTFDDDTSDGHEKKIIGRIDEIWRGEWKGQTVLMGRGVFRDTVVEAQDAIDGIATGFFRGLSVDVDMVEIEMPADDDEQGLADMLFGGGDTVFKAARIADVAIVGIPAFQEAFIALGPDFGELDALAACGCTDALSEEQLDELADEIAAYQAEQIDSSLVASASFAPGTHDGPGWITNPKATERIRHYWVKGEGAAKIRWGVPGDFNRCRAQLAKYVQNPDWLAGLCANMHKEALGVWPGQEAAGRTQEAGALTASAVSLVAAAPTKVLPGEFFHDPGLTEPTPLTITPDGHIFGHLATWGTCHIGMSGICTEPPRSPSSYQLFRVGMVTTTEGDVFVGQVTMNTGHAGDRDSLTSAKAHYDNTGAAVADIAIGDDGVGIWFSGAMRDSATEQQWFDLRASGKISGDWRDFRGELELIGALAVNVPGFPQKRIALAASGQRQLSLVASGMVDRPNEKITASGIMLDADAVAAISRTAVAEYIHQSERAPRVAEAKAKAAEFRAEFIARAKEKIGA